MKKTGKKLFGLLLALVMVLSLMPVTAATVRAEETAPGTEQETGQEQGTGQEQEQTTEQEAVKVSGSVNASDLQDGDTLLLEDDTVLNMDVNRVLSGISGEGCSLTLEGGATLSVVNTAGTAIEVESLFTEGDTGSIFAESTVEECYGILAKTVRINGGSISAAGKAADVSCTDLTVNAGGLYSMNSDPSLFALYGIEASSKVVIKGGDVVMNGSVTGIAADSIHVSGGSVSGFGMYGIGTKNETVVSAGTLMGFGTIYGGVIDGELKVEAGIDQVTFALDNESSAVSSEDPEGTVGGPVQALYAAKGIQLGSGAIIRIPVGGKIEGSEKDGYTVYDGAEAAKTVTIISGHYITGWKDTGDNAKAVLIDGEKLKSSDQIGRSSGEEIAVTIETPEGYGIKGGKVSISGGSSVSSEGEEGAEEPAEEASAETEFTVTWDGSKYVGSFVMPSNDVFLTFETVPVYTVKFNTGEGSDVPDQVVEEGKTAVRPENPTWGAYGFGGWQDENGDLFDFATEITEDIELTAVWTATVTFITNGGEPVEPQVVQIGNTVKKPALSNRQVGTTWYELEGWYTDQGYTSAYDFDKKVTGNLTLYAKWVAITYTVTAGSGGTWTKGSTTGYSVTVKRSPTDTSFAHFDGGKGSVQIGTTTLTKGTDYTAKEGSTIITLTPTLMSRLTVGSHTIVVNFDDGRATAAVTVRASSTPSGGGSSSRSSSTSSAKTGVEDYMGLWMALALAAALAALVISRKRAQR